MSHDTFTHREDGRVCIPSEGWWLAPADAGGEGYPCDRPHGDERLQAELGRVRRTLREALEAQAALPSVDVSALTAVTIDTRELSRIYLEVPDAELARANEGFGRPECGAPGGPGEVAGHECRCDRPANHGPSSAIAVTAGHVCACGAIW